MFVIAINHDVKDYAVWKDAFDSYPPTEHGAAFHRVNRSIDDANNITVVAGFPTAEGAAGFRDDPELGEKMQLAGVAGPPRIEIFEEVEVVSQT